MKSRVPRHKILSVSGPSSDELILVAPGSSACMPGNYTLSDRLKSSVGGGGGRARGGAAVCPHQRNSPSASV